MLYGLTAFPASIRAYGAESAFIQESLIRIDRYTRTTRAYYNLNRWVDVRADALGALFSASLAAYLVYAQNARVFNVGFSLNMAMGFTSKLNFWVRSLNRFEIEGTP